MASYAPLIELPRGPLQTARRERDIPDDYTNRVLAWRDAAINQGLAEARDNPEWDEVANYIQILEGRWEENTLQSTRRDRMTDNKIAQARIEALAYLTDIKPTIDVRTSVEEYKSAAEAIKGIIQHEWKVRRMDVALEEVLDHALFGTGYWKISCSYPGEFSVLSCGMDTVIPIQQGKDLQDSTAVLYRAFKPPHFYKSRWRERAEGIEREAETVGIVGIQSNQYTRPWNVNEYSWNSMSPAMRYHKVRTSPGSSIQTQYAEFPLIQLQEYWIEDWNLNESQETVIVKDPYKELDEHNYWYRVAPGERLYPRKRLLVFAGDRLMYDGPSPYWHGMFPFAKLRLNPIIWSSGGLSLYRDIRHLNVSINRITVGVEKLVEKSLNPTVISKDGAVNSTSWEKFFAGKAGSKLKLTPIANPATDVRFIDPPQLPGYVEQQRQYLLQSYREHAGSLDMASMTKKKQLPGGDTIEQFKDSQTAPRRRQLRNIEIFLEDAGRIALSDVTQFFSIDQRIKILGSRGTTKQDFDAKPGTMFHWATLPEEFHQNFAIEVSPGSLHSGSKDRAKQVAIVLRRQRDISRRELYRQLEVGNGDQIEAELKEEGPVGPPPKGQGRTNMTRGQKNAKPV